MKGIIVASLLSSLISPKSFNLKRDVELNYKIYFNNESNLVLKRSDNIVFAKGGEGVLLHYYKENDEYGAILYNKTNDKVEAIYNSPFNPIKNNNNNICLDPFEFVTEEALNSLNNKKVGEKTNTSIKNFKKVSYKHLNFDYKDYCFFKINSNVDALYMYVSSELSQVKLKGVPNYYNSTYPYYKNGKLYYAGCAPTTALSYLAYLDRYSNSSILEGDYPLNHDDNKVFVDNAIKNLGDKFFKTTSNNGTTKSNIISGYSKYLSTRGFSGYSTICVEVYNDLNTPNSASIQAFNNYFGFIQNVKQPVHLSKADYSSGEYSGWHSLLGTGAKIINHTTKDNEYFVSVNRVFDSVAINIDIELGYIRRYYYVCK